MEPEAHGKFQSRMSRQVACLGTTFPIPMMPRIAFALALLPALSLSSLQPVHAAEGRVLFSNLRMVPQTPHEAHDAAQRAEGDAKRKSDPKLAKFAAKLEADRAAARKTVILSDRDVYWNDDGQGQFVVLLNEYEMAQSG